MNWNIEACGLQFWDKNYFVNVFSFIYATLLMKTLSVGYYVVCMFYFLGYFLNGQTLLLINFILPSILKISQDLF